MAYVERLESAAARFQEEELRARLLSTVARLGQACSYNLGQLKIRELRERAKQQLGTKFDLKTFHGASLSVEYGPVQADYCR